MRKIALLIALLLIVLCAIPALAETQIKLREQPMAAGPPPLDKPAAQVTPQAQTPYQPMGAGPPPLPGAGGELTPPPQTPYQPMSAGPPPLPGAAAPLTK